jgi:hypothetical protein
VSKDFKEIYAIDVDSYQTKSYPATVIMDSIKDRHITPFSEASDWFSFAVVAFQMLIGIHPYKGIHSIKDLDERMKKNISVFDSSVGIPTSAYPLTSLVEPFLSWFKNTFDTNFRSAFPDGSATFINQVINTVKSAKFIIDLLGDSEKYILDGINKINLKIENGILQGSYLNKIGQIKSNLACESFFVYNDTGYVKNGSAIYEVSVVNSTLVGRLVASVMPQATSVYRGCVIQSILGSTFLDIFPKRGYHYSIRLKELDGYRVIDACFDKIALVVAEKGGIYHRFIISPNENYTSVTVRIVKDISYLDANLCSFKGKSVIMTDTGMELFLNSNLYNIVTLEDTGIDQNCRLFSKDDKACFELSGKEYSFRMR